MEDNNGTPENTNTELNSDPAASSAAKHSLDIPAKEVSAATIGRMMGLVTASDLKLLDSKVDLLVTKVAALTMKLDKALSLLSATPTGSDLERIDIQVGSFKSMLRESMQAIEEAVAKKN